MNCKICSSPAVSFATAKVLNKYEARYLRCPKCGLVFVDQPTWLAESYESAIARTDIGSVSRAIGNAWMTKSVLEFYLHQGTARCIDYGAGYGIFVRRMRDLGYDFWAYDRYCANLFAEDFRLESLEGQRFALATSFEVFEHLEDPLTTFAEIFARCDALLLTTELLPVPVPAPQQWWYYGLDHGQHVTLYTREALQHVARKFSRRLYTDGHSVHLLVTRCSGLIPFRLVVSSLFARAMAALRRRTSLHAHDFDLVRERARRTTVPSSPDSSRP